VVNAIDPIHGRSQALDLLQRRHGINIIRDDADNTHVVAAEAPAYRVVVLLVGVLLVVELFDRKIGTEMPGFRTEERSRQQREQHGELWPLNDQSI
jgi:hypothetical protein